MAANNNLSLAATAIKRALQRDDEIEADLAAWYAPSECGDLVEWSDLDAVVEPFGFGSVGDFERECRARGVTGHWLSFVLGVQGGAE